MANSAAFQPVELIMVDEQHPLRETIEQYVYQRYSLAFHADIEQFMPVFLVLFEAGQIRSVCGIRPASSQPLFLEQYLDKPVEALLSQQFAHSIVRERVIEFGQLASFSHGFSPLHFYLMTEQLTKMGYHWCVCTVTGPLFSLMKRLGLNPVIMSRATAERVVNADKWGNYYLTTPQVIAGNLVESCARLKRVTTRMTNPEMDVSSIRRA